MTGPDAAARAYRLVSAVTALGEAQRDAAMSGEDPVSDDVPAVLRTLRAELPEVPEVELTDIGTAILKWCSSCYQLGKVARRIRRRDFDSGRRLGRAEAEEDLARQAWTLPLLAAASSGSTAGPGSPNTTGDPREASPE